jgi:hypothetical protein
MSDFNPEMGWRGPDKDPWAHAVTLIRSAYALEREAE